MKQKIFLQFNTCFILTSLFLLHVAVPVSLAQLDDRLSSSAVAGEDLPDQIIIRFGANTRYKERQTIIEDLNCSLAGWCAYSDLYLVQIPENQEPLEMVSAYQSNNAVLYAELNYPVRQFLIPNDSFYFFQWNFDNDVSGSVNVESAWDIQTGDPNVIIAVLDTGAAYEDYDIYAQASDLAQTRFVQGYDFINNDTHPNDDQGHGTHVTGTIAQSTNNFLGTAGIAFDCSIMPVKVIDDSGTGSVFTIAQGIYFATITGANVINMSLGTDTPTQTLKEAVEFAYLNGLTIVCAVGNDFLEDNTVSYPAAYDDYCIAVGATRYDETRAYYSNTGSHIDIVAPGGDLEVDQNGDFNPDGILQQTFGGDPAIFNYYFLQGTSAAAPHVTGAAALLISNGVTDPNKVRQALEITAKDINMPGYDEETGWGLLDIGAALNYSVEGDFNGDLFVSPVDIAVFADQWLLNTEPCPAADLNADGIVDFFDFAIMAQNFSK